MKLIDKLIKNGWLKSPRIIKAFREIERVDFLPAYMRTLAELDEPLPIGKGQTISQPLVVAFMLEQLQPEPGNIILDIGAGSGWTTALLSHIVGQEGKVIAMEIIPELEEFGEKNVAKYGFIKQGIVEFVCGDASKGYPELSLRSDLAEGFDRILASASGKELPGSWKEQLKIGGRIVAPIKSSIWVFIKKSYNHFEEKEHPGFAFVPLVGKNK